MKTRLQKAEETIHSFLTGESFEHWCGLDRRGRAEHISDVANMIDDGASNEKISEYVQAI